MTTADGIRWPDYFVPANVPVHVKNDIEIPAPVETVWAWLIRAKLWPTWYSNSANVWFRTGTGPDLEAGTRFRWKTFGVTCESEVMEFVPKERIAWDAHSFGVDAYHAWVLTGTPQGCHVLTEESQHGSLAILQKVFRPNNMHRKHQIWLDSLKEKASEGLPPAVRSGAMR
ncbi:MAG TPA: SRPBCC domain-containing protein [Thermoanaerobaculia bacterium]|jgi:uncharacterized protein YndB with AHSA1/START domain